MTFNFEVRRQRRWGSQHEKWFACEVVALAYIDDQIKGRGHSGGSYNRVGDVFYYSPYPDDDT